WRGPARAAQTASGRGRSALETGSHARRKCRPHNEIGRLIVDRTFAALGALFGFLGVAAGAFGAHALRTRLSPDDLAIFETAARYQMYHALALLAAAWVETRWPGAAGTVAGWLFVGGTVVFSGSLY